MRKNLDTQAQTLAPQKSQYEECMVAARELVNHIEGPADVSPAVKAIKALPHALTSEKEATAMLKEKLAELNIVWDRSAKVYKYAEE